MDNNEVSRITCEELKQLLDKGNRLVVVDTRDISSYNAGHIPKAINIHYDATGDPMERGLRLTALPQDRLLALYCD